MRSLFVGLVMGVVMLAAGSAAAQYGRTPDSEIDPKTFLIDEKTYLGVKLDSSLAMVDEQGRPFTLGDKLGKPLIVVLAYYQCDGTCSVVNADLKRLMGGVDRLAIGKDFGVLTITFDKNDTQETLAKFRKVVDIPAAWESGWAFGLPTDPVAMRRMTDNIGYKYFWSPRDHTFFHPGVYVVLSGEGRAVRFLYSTSTTARDLELALIDAQRGQVGAPTDLINFAVSLCYSYNYKEGRYTLNIPVFVGAGSLVFGILVLTVSVVGYRWRKRRERTA